MGGLGSLGRCEYEGGRGGDGVRRGKGDGGVNGKSVFLLRIELVQ